MKEIVGAQIGGLITSNPLLIAQGLARDTIKQFLTRQHMEFMSSADLGKNWDDMAKAPALFVMDDDGNITLPENSPQQDS